MSSIVLAVGNGKTLFGGSGVAPDADLVRFVDPESPIINAFDLCALRGDGIFEATTVWKGFPVSLENHLKRLANSARLVDMPEPNIPALTRAVQLVIDQYDDPEPGPMLRIIVSRGLDPDTGVGKAADRTPTVYIFLDAKGTLHSLEPITMASMTRGYPSDITARAPWLLNGAKTLSYAFNCAVHRECAPPWRRRRDSVHGGRLHDGMPEFVDCGTLWRYVRHARPAHRYSEWHITARNVRLGA
jgi:4-amino-4-deoxychorismate lyase